MEYSSRPEFAAENGIFHRIASNLNCCCRIFELIPSNFQAVFLGQLMSICLCGTAISSQFLSNGKFNAPTAQNLPTYLILMAIYGSTFLCKSKERRDYEEVGNDEDDRELLSILKNRGWKYLALALIDVEANFAMVYAYQFTTITAIQLLDCFTIPIVMVLSAIFLTVRYTKRHFSGVGICLIGLGLTIYTDAFRGSGLEGGSNKLLGDLLCLLGTFLYSVANVSEEFLVKQYSRSEYLAMVGLFGFLFSSVQVILLEYQNLAQFQWSAFSAAMFLLFTVSMVCFYSLVSVVMHRSSALLFNISVLTADFYSLLAGVFVFGQKFDAFYFIAFLIIIVGTLIYNYRSNDQMATSNDEQIQRIEKSNEDDEEGGISNENADDQRF